MIMATIQGMTQADERLCSQLYQFNERIRMYAARSWQLPIAYLSAVAITASNINTSTPKQIQIAIGIGLFLVGCTIGVILFCYQKRINELVVITKKLESHMELTLTSVIRYEKRILFLYEFIILIAIALSVFIAIK